MLKTNNGFSDGYLPGADAASLEDAGPLGLNMVSYLILRRVP
jgi:hypothetical protein